MKYHGKICDKHPELEGLRYSSCRKCVTCHNVVAPKARRVTVKMATPPWADVKEIGRIFRKAAKEGKAVDHVIPLNHPKVCGLHVPLNLKAKPKSKNLSKGNRFRVITSKPKEF